MEYWADVCYFGLWEDGLMCAILVCTKMVLCVLSWSRETCYCGFSWSVERWADVCYLGLWKDGLVCGILVKGKLC